MEFVEGQAGGIDDIRTDEIRAPQGKGVVFAIDAIVCRKQVSVDIKPDRLYTGLTQISSEQRVVRRQLVIDTRDPVLPVIDGGIAVENLSTWVSRFRKEGCELHGRCTQQFRIDLIVHERRRERDRSAVLAGR